MFSPLELRKRNVIYIRGIFTFIILLLGLYDIGNIIESQQYILLYFVVLIASNFVFMYLPLRYYEGIKFHYIVFVLDIIFVALGAYWLAYLDFMFLIVVFLTIFIAALGQSVKMSILIAVVINALYVFMKVSSSEKGFDLFVEQNILLNIPFLFMVALHSSYIAEKAGEDINEKRKLEKANQLLSGQIKVMSEDMASAMEFMERFYDSFRDAIIILDDGCMVRQFNRKSEMLFNIKRSKAVNVLYREVQELGDVVKYIQDIKMNKQPAFDRQCVIEIAGIKKTIIVNTSFIRDRSENVLGYLVLIKQRLDKTEEVA